MTNGDIIRQMTDEELAIYLEALMLESLAVTAKMPQVA